MTRQEKFERTKARLLAEGYRLEVARDGTERLYRPDQTLAVISQPSGRDDAPVHRV